MGRAREKSGLGKHKGLSRFAPWVLFSCLPPRPILPDFRSRRERKSPSGRKWDLTKFTLKTLTLDVAGAVLD